MTKLTISLFAICLLGACGPASNRSSSPDSTIVDTSLITTDTTSTQLQKKESNWEYTEDEDKMTSKKTFLARSISPTDLNFDFPYKEAFAYLTVRKKRGTTDIIVAVSTGQFKTSYDGTNIRARFDQEKPQTYSVSESSSGSTELLFIDNVSKFLKNLKTHKKLIIEAEFYSEGTRQIEYNIADFKWNH